MDVKPTAVVRQGALRVQLRAQPEMGPVRRLAHLIMPKRDRPAMLVRLAGIARLQTVHIRIVRGRVGAIFRTAAAAPCQSRHGEAGAVDCASEDSVENIICQSGRQWRMSAMMRRGHGQPPGRNIADFPRGREQMRPSSYGTLVKAVGKLGGDRLKEYVPAIIDHLVVAGCTAITKA